MFCAKKVTKLPDLTVPLDRPKALTDQTYLITTGLKGQQYLCCPNSNLIVDMWELQLVLFRDWL